jgi:hypothetical protein
MAHATLQGVQAYLECLGYLESALLADVIISEMERVQSRVHANGASEGNGTGAFDTIVGQVKLSQRVVHLECFIELRGSRLFNRIACARYSRL